MKRLFFLGSFLMVLTSCTLTKKPELLGFREVKLQNFKKDSVTFKAIAKFHNPNIIGGDITTKGLKASINELQFCKLKDQQIKVKARKDFEMPIEFPFAYADVLSFKKSLLTVLLNSVITSEFKVSLEGDILYKGWFIKKTHPLKYEKKVELSK